MKTLLSFACLLALTTLSTQTVLADIAKPKPPDQPKKIALRTHLDIVPDAKAYQARLQITQSELQELRAALDGTNANTTIGASIARSPVRTIVAGLLLFLSVSFAGVWLARSKRNSALGRTQKAVAAGILVAAVVGAAAIITQGNAGPPPGYLAWKDLSKNLAQGRTSSGQLVIEVVPDSSNDLPGVKLFIPVEKQKQADDE